ncbi:MAG: hypothetical protein IPP40_14640 [bacterium]|nr:hypothetical protein [bacterium]
MKNPLLHVQRLRNILLLLPLLCLVLFTNKAVAQDWSAIGNGLPFWTHAVCEYNGEIIAGGEAPGFLKRFDGINWVDIGGGVDGQVNALTVYNGELIAAGQFVNAGGIEVMFIAKWDGIEWLDLEGGTNSTVSALTVYNGNLIAGGYFTDANGPANYIAQWDGHAWSALGAGAGGTQGQVLALTVYQNEVDCRRILYIRRRKPSQPHCQMEWHYMVYIRWWSCANTLCSHAVWLKSCSRSRLSLER